MTYRDRIQAETLASAHRWGGTKGAKMRRHYRLCRYWFRCTDRTTERQQRREE